MPLGVSIHTWPCCLLACSKASWWGAYPEEVCAYCSQAAEVSFYKAPLLKDPFPHSSPGCVRAINTWPLGDISDLNPQHQDGEWQLLQRVKGGIGGATSSTFCCNHRWGRLPPKKRRGIETQLSTQGNLLLITWTSQPAQAYMVGFRMSRNAGARRVASSRTRHRVWETLRPAFSCCWPVTLSVLTPQKLVPIPSFQNTLGLICWMTDTVAHWLGRVPSSL